jgi:hypothetical protein
VLDGQYFTTDHQCANNFFNLSEQACVVVVIEKGQMVGRLRGNALQFGTKSLWTKQLVALGDASTMQDNGFETYKGMPAQTVKQSTRAPAGLFKDVDVISTEIKL